MVIIDTGDCGIWSVDLTTGLATLRFTDCRIPASAMLGGEGEGFQLMMTKLSQERLARSAGS